MKRASTNERDERTPQPQGMLPKIKGVTEAVYKEMISGIISGRTDDLKTFHARGDREDCDRCITDTNRRAKAEKGRGGAEGALTPCKPPDDPSFVQYRCSNCVRRHSNCSWKRTLLVDGAIDYLKVSEEQAIALYEAWGKSYSYNFGRKRRVNPSTADVGDDDELEVQLEGDAGPSSNVTPPAKRARQASLKQKQISFATVSKGARKKKGSQMSSTIAPQSIGFQDADEKSSDEDKKNGGPANKNLEIKELWTEVERLKAMVVKEKGSHASLPFQNLQGEIQELRDALEEERKTTDEQRQLLAAKDNDNTQSTKILRDLFAKLGMWSFQLKNALEATPEQMQTRVREVLAGVDEAGIKCAFHDT